MLAKLKSVLTVGGIVQVENNPAYQRLGYHEAHVAGAISTKWPGWKWLIIRTTTSTPCVVQNFKTDKSASVNTLLKTRSMEMKQMLCLGSGATCCMYVGSNSPMCGRQQRQTAAQLSVRSAQNHMLGCSNTRRRFASAIVQWPSNNQNVGWNIHGFVKVRDQMHTKVSFLKNWAELTWGSSLVSQIYHSKRCAEASKQLAHPFQ